MSGVSSLIGAAFGIMAFSFRIGDTGGKLPHVQVTRLHAAHHIPIRLNEHCAAIPQEYGPRGRMSSAAENPQKSPRLRLLILLVESAIHRIHLTAYLCENPGR